MKAVKAGLIFFLAASVFILFDLFFTVREDEQAVVTQLGVPIASVRQAGLHLKLPYVQRTTVYEKRSLRWDSGLLEISTKDGIMICVDVVARWRIVDPMKFLETVGAYDRAYARLDEIIDPIVKEKVSAHILPELVRSSDLILKGSMVEGGATVSALGARAAHETVIQGRGKVTRSILSEASRSVSRFGIELLDVKFRRLGYAESVNAKVYERMISERKCRAAQLKAEGEGRKAEISGQMAKELRTIRSEAFRSAEEIKGRADSEAARIYGQAYGKDPEFASFFKTLQTYRETPFENTTLIMGTDSEYYKFLKGAKR